MTDEEFEALMRRHAENVERHRKLVLREIDKFNLYQRCHSLAEYQRRVKDLP